MNRFSRISTIWRKEFADTLRDRRTLIAMVLVPMVLYPVLMLGSLQAVELQFGRLKREESTVAVASAEVRDWLEAAIQRDEEIRTEHRKKEREQASADGDANRAGAASAGVREEPPPYKVELSDHVRQAVIDGQAATGLLVADGPLPTEGSSESARVAILVDNAEIRSRIAAAGLEGILERAGEHLVELRLKQANRSIDFIRPIALEWFSVESPEKLGGSRLGQIIALMLVVLTLTGAIYPAIDLTAGERERGTLETLMAAPVPKVDLIAGKFVVVASIGMLSAVLNLVSMGGTAYFGGLGSILTGGNQATIPLHTLPLILLVLIPLAVMFSALLLAVCSFARSFKEAQNYVMPVMMAVLIPAIIGVLPGTELEGPLLILPVTNIVILTRELFMGQVDHLAILWVTVSTCIYAGAAVAVAAKLFGQEAVLFADSASIRTLFRRRFFKPLTVPSAAQAFLLMAVAYLLNFFVQQSIMKAGVQPGSAQHLAGLALTLVVLFTVLPAAVAKYTRVRIASAFSLAPPKPAAALAGLCFGCSTWVLALAWMALQQRVLPLPPEFVEAAKPLEEQLRGLPLEMAILFVAIAPAFCEELFFRGYALSGLRGALGKVGAVLLVALAFGATHYSVHKLVVTAALGVLLGLLVIQFRSIWPAILAHLMHNAMIVLISREDGLLPYLQRFGFIDEAGQELFPPPLWLTGAGILTAAGILLCVFGPRAGNGKQAPRE